MILSNLKVYWFLQVSQRVWCSAAVYTFLVGIKKKKTKTGGWGKGRENVFFLLKPKNLLEMKNKLTMQACPSIWLSLVLTCQPNTSLSHTVANVLLGFKPTVKAGLLNLKKKQTKKHCCHSTLQIFLHFLTPE